MNDRVRWLDVEGRKTEAVELARQVLTIAERYNLRPAMAAARIRVGQAALLTEDVSAGATMIRHGIDLWLASWSVLLLTWKATEPAWAMAAIGNISGVREYLELGERSIRETEERVGAPELLRLRACLARDAHDLEAARTLLHESIEVARRQGARYFKLLAALDLVELSKGTSEAANALAELQRVYGGFTEGFDFPVMKSARKILESRQVVT